jgi:hypothetical protein
MSRTIPEVRTHPPSIVLTPFIPSRYRHPFSFVSRDMLKPSHQPASRRCMVVMGVWTSDSPFLHPWLYNYTHRVYCNLQAVSNPSCTHGVSVSRGWSEPGY